MFLASGLRSGRLQKRTPKFPTCIADGSSAQNTRFKGHSLCLGDPESVARSPHRMDESQRCPLIGRDAWVSRFDDYWGVVLHC